MTKSTLTTYRFAAMPITVSGNVPVMRVTGEVDWTLAKRGDKWRIAHVERIALKGEDGGLIDIEKTGESALWTVLLNALEDNLAVAPKPDAEPTADLDSAAQKEPDQLA